MAEQNVLDAFTHPHEGKAPENLAPTWEHVSEEPGKYWGTNRDPITTKMPSTAVQQMQFDFTDFLGDDFFTPLKTGELWELYSKRCKATEEDPEGTRYQRLAMSVYKRITGGYTLNLAKLHPAQKKLMGMK